VDESNPARGNEDQNIMASACTGDIQRHLQQLFVAGSAVGLTDGQLLERFAGRGGADAFAEAAFEIILARHGATVLTVCRQVLGDGHAAEDAFQATFLVLVRRAGSLRVREPGSLGPWLYGVAYRTALKARQGAARRRARERRVAVPEARSGQVTATLERDDLGRALHAEVNRLPAKYRAPVVLCYFEGRTHDEAAAALQWPVGTVRSNLSRARELLRARLTRRGLAPAGLIGTALRVPDVRAEVPTALREATIAAAIKGTPAAAGAAALARLMLRSLLLTRVRMTAAVLATTLITAGLGLVLRGTPALQPPDRADPTPAADPTARHPSTLVDRFGDPLPKFARARMGTNRFHDGSLVNQVLYTPDAKSLVTVDNIPIVRVWDATTGQIVRDIGDPQADFPDITPSRAIALSPDGKTLATVDYPSRLRLWEVATGREHRRWREAKDQEYERPTFSPDSRTVAVGVSRYDRATKTSETFIELWDTDAPSERRRRIPGGWVRLWVLNLSPQGKIQATASTDTEIMDGNTLIGPGKISTRLWDPSTGRERARFPLAGALTFSPDGKLLAVVDSGGTVRLYDLTTGQERMPRLGPEQPRPPAGDVKAVPGQPMEIRCLAFSPDGSILASGDASSSNPSLAAIHLWDVARGQERRRFPAHLQGVASLSFSPDGKTLASCGTGPVLRLWDVATGQEVFPQSGHGSAIRTLVISPADGTVFTGGDDGTIRHWDPSSGRELDLIAQLGGPVEALAIAQDGKTLLVRGWSKTQTQQAGQMGLWSVAEHREIRRLAPFGERDVHYVAYSPDGKTVASEGRIWDTHSGKLLVTLRHHDPQDGHFLSFSPMFYTPDGKQVITAEPCGAWIWDLATGREARRAIRWSNYHDRATLSPDGRFLATCGPGGRSRGQSDDPPIIIWELASGQEVARLEAHGEALLLRPFSPDGRFLASASRHRGTIPNSTVRVLDLATGREVRRFEGHRGSVNAVAFTPDGRSLVSASEDATALVWDVSDLRDRRESGMRLTPEVLESRWDELAGSDALVAYRATWALSVPPAVPFLRDHLRPATAAEPINSPGDLRTLRAIATLERIGTHEARGVIERLAQGDPNAITTREAASTLDRLKRAMGR
jgi:RNA polymerase sigma factor (sigma-70 family)